MDTMLHGIDGPPEPAGRVPIMARRRTISRGKLALLEATAAMAPNAIVMCAGTVSLPERCASNKGRFQYS